MDYLVMVTIGGIGFLMLHLHHCYPEARREKDMNYFRNGVEGSSFIELDEFGVLSKIVEFMFAGIEYHHIHHLN